MEQSQGTTNQGKITKSNPSQNWGGAAKRVKNGPKVGFKLGLKAEPRLLTKISSNGPTSKSFNPRNTE